MTNRSRLGVLLLSASLVSLVQVSTGRAQTTAATASTAIKPSATRLTQATPTTFSKTTTAGTSKEGTVLKNTASKQAALDKAAANETAAKEATLSEGKTSLSKLSNASKTLQVQLRPAAQAAPDAPISPSPSPNPTGTGRPPQPSAAPDTAQLKHAPAETFVLHSDNSRTAVGQNTSSVTLRAGDVLLARSDEAPVAIAKSVLEGASAVRLPYEVLFIDEQGTERHCEVFAEMAGGGLRLTGDGAKFATQIYVGLRDQNRWDQVYSLPHPLRLLVTANVDRVAPDLVLLERTNDFKPVELTTTDPATDVRVQVRAADKGLELNVPVHRPRVTLDVNPKKLQGFGLESAQIHIRTEGLPNPKGRSVRLQTSSGRLVTNGLTLDENGALEAELRSAGFGAASLEVSVFQLAPDQSAVEFEWPWRFLGFALLGGTLGTATTWLQAASRRRTNWKPLAASVLTGLMAATASAVGINLLSIDLPSMGGESLALVIAALGAWGLVKVKPAAATA